MSKLTDSLRQMSDWMKNQNEFLMGELEITAFRPGLSDLEIDSLTHSRSFKIPQELRELYKWHNGDWSQQDYRFTKEMNQEIQNFLYFDPGVMYRQIQTCFNEELRFLSLDFVVSNIQYFSKFEDKLCLPIFSEENGHYSVLVNNEKIFRYK